MRIRFRLFCFVASLVILSYFNYLFFANHVIPGLAEFYTVQLVEVALNHAFLIWTLPAAYVLIASNICLIVCVFKPLKKPWEEGLLGSLIRGFLSALIVGLTIWIIAGILVSLTAGLIEGPDGWFLFLAELSPGIIWALILGLMLGLTPCLVISVVDGIRQEFD